MRLDSIQADAESFLFTLLVGCLVFDVRRCGSAQYGAQRRHRCAFGHHGVGLHHLAEFGAAGGVNDDILPLCQLQRAGGEIVHLARFGETDADDLYLFFGCLFRSRLGRGILVGGGRR